MRIPPPDPYAPATQPWTAPRVPPAGQAGHGPVGLLLTGGGARAAYQVGVLEAIAELRAAADERRGSTPFTVISGTSAGAINAAAIATHADDFRHAVARLAQVWRDMRPDKIYRTDTLSTLSVAGHWRMMFGLARLLNRWRTKEPRSLLDNAPLAELLAHTVPLERLPALMAAGHLQALAISASNYSGGEHYTFYQSARHTPPWARSQRVAMPGQITHDHLLASAAIPFVFPATGIAMPDGHTEYFGDGSIRQSFPLSAAIHLGAERVLAIGAGRMGEPHEAAGPNVLSGYPTLAQIAGHAMSSIFLDALAADVERTQRVNQTLSLIPAAARAATGLRPVELLVISPSQRIDAIASRHAAALPGALRRTLGCSQRNTHQEVNQASALTSYLLFDGEFTQELMALGHADALRQCDAINTFFGWDRHKTTLHQERLNQRDQLLEAA